MSDGFRLDAENEALVQEALDSLMHQMQGTCALNQLGSLGVVGTPPLSPLGIP